MEKEEKLYLTDKEMVIMAIVLDSVRKDIQKENNEKFANAFHSRFPDVSSEKVEKALDTLRECQSDESKKL